jgi:transcriptional regulator with XRE-family HTH domain
MRLGFILKEYCYQKRIGVREMAKIMGCSASTVSRFFNGEAIEGETLANLLIWILQTNLTPQDE